MAGTFAVEGTVAAGHGVASGSNPHSPFPAGTIELQIPHFARRGLDLSSKYPATINVDIAPSTFALRTPRITFPDVHWTDVHAAETFSFLRCRLSLLPAVGRDDESSSTDDGSTDTQEPREYEGWVYYPHPETKPMHEQPTSVLEVLMPYVDGLTYGDRVRLRLDAAEIEIHAAKD